MKYLIIALCFILSGCDDDSSTCPTSALSSTTISSHEPVDSAVVPEPATYALIVLGLLVFAYRKQTA